MFRNVILALALGTLPAPLPAQQWNQQAYYIAWIGPEDMRNSRGQPVTSLGGVIQQDRANFHRFGLRHPQDEGDPVFADQATRARIPQMVAAGGNDRGSLAAMARSGRPFGVGVFVCGNGNTPSVIYLHGFGEDHSGCF
ncbi:hypothetical protein [Oceaniglobus roseus]|uniref:hypothetical protein n=1 Tax=Oceaniglobus roseus TaxID=1737570 RepID=UPI000C7F5EDB|nr:hypothetical protein [Kandeliimicrobium roseum]